MQGIKGFPQILAGLSVILIAAVAWLYVFGAGPRSSQQLETYSNAVEQREASEAFSQAIERQDAAARSREEAMERWR